MEINCKKIMILGGGINQYPFVKAARELGLVVILCDKNEQNMSHRFADKFYPVSITEKETILKIASYEQIDGIISSSEIGMHSVSYVASKLHLPSIPYESFQILASKVKMKRFLSQNGFNYPKYLLVGKTYNIDDIKSSVSKWNSRFIVKPIDSSGSRGVRLIEHVTKLEESILAALHYSKSKEVIIEEYIEQKYDFMVGGDIFVVNNTIVFWGIMDSMRDLRINSYVPTGTSYPSSISNDEMRRVKRNLEKIVKLLAINFGAFNIEIMFDKDQRLFINEINPRNGGNSIPEILLEATGFNFYKNVCLGACGLFDRDHDDFEERFRSTHVIHSKEDGIFQNLLISDEIKNNVTKIDFDRKIGENVFRFTDASKKIGVLFLAFHSFDEMSSKLSRINDYVEVILD